MLAPAQSAPAILGHKRRSGPAPRPAGAGLLRAGKRWRKPSLGVGEGSMPAQSHFDTAVQLKPCPCSPVPVCHRSSLRRPHKGRQRDVGAKRCQRRQGLWSFSSAIRRPLHPCAAVLDPRPPRRPQPSPAAPAPAARRGSCKFPRTPTAPRSANRERAGTPAICPCPSPPSIRAASIRRSPTSPPPTCFGFNLRRPKGTPALVNVFLCI